MKSWNWQNGLAVLLAVTGGAVVVGYGIAAVDNPRVSVDGRPPGGSISTSAAPSRVPSPSPTASAVRPTATETSSATPGFDYAAYPGFPSPAPSRTPDPTREAMPLDEFARQWAAAMAAPNSPRRGLKLEGYAELRPEGADQLKGVLGRAGLTGDDIQRGSATDVAIVFSGYGRYNVLYVVDRQHGWYVEIMSEELDQLLESLPDR